MSFNRTPERRPGGVVHSGPPEEKTRCDRCDRFPSWRQPTETERLCELCRREGGEQR